MPIFLTDDDDDFFSVKFADEHGIIAVGGELSSDRLIRAYRLGIFPWPHEGLPVLWFCPEPRFVLKPNNIIINQTLRKALKRSSLTINADLNFNLVIKKCAEANRKNQEGTWITDDMIAAYQELHVLGFAHSIEAYDGDLLVGGLYGVSMGTIFFGESMFFDKKDASKICFVTLVAQLIDWNFSLIDCQAHTHHLEKFGAHAMRREDFLEEIKKNEKIPSRLGPWHFRFTPQEALQRIIKI